MTIIAALAGIVIGAVGTLAWLGKRIFEEWK